EEIVFGKVSTGALSDLERITKMAYGIVTIYGMNDKIGNVSFYDSKQSSDYAFTKPYSDATAQLIDEEVKKIIDDCYQRTKALLKEKSNELEVVAKELLDKEIIFQTDLERLIGKRPFDTQTTYEAYTNPNGHDTKKEDEISDNLDINDSIVQPEESDNTAPAENKNA
ncbi:MAG: peptidase M41, partial [Bacteroidota bacterium]